MILRAAGSARWRAVLLVALCLGLAVRYLSSGHAEQLTAAPRRQSSSPSSWSKSSTPVGISSDLPVEHEVDDGFSPLGALGIDHWVPGKRKKLLITGGASQLALALVPSLLKQYEIFLLDNIPRPLSLSQSPWIHYYRPSSFRSIITSYGLEGVIDLASLAHAERCEAAPLHCQDTQQAPLSELLELLGPTEKRTWWSKDTSPPWLIWGTHTFSTKGQTVLATIQAYLDKVGGTSQLVKASIVRLPYIYGYDPETALAGSFFHSLLVNSVTSEHTQYDSDLASLDLLHVDDAVSALLNAIKRIQRSSADQEALETYSLTSGHTTSRKDLVTKVRELTHTLGPVKDIGSGKSAPSSDPQITSFSAPSNDALGWKPTVDLATGLRRSVDDMLSSTIRWAESYIDDHCATSDHDDSLLTTNLHNADMSKLEGCTVNLGFNRADLLDYVKCPVPGNGTICTVDRRKVASMNWDASVFTVRTATQGGWKGTKPKGRKVRVRLEEELSGHFLGLPRFGHEMAFNLYTLKESFDAAVDFDLEASPELCNHKPRPADSQVDSSDSYLRLLLPGTSTQVTAVADGAQTVMEYAPASSFDARMLVLCCPSQTDWPLLADDYETADIRFGTTANIPFNSSRKVHTCDRAHASIQYSQSILSGSSAAAVTKAEFTSTVPEEWALRDLPPCWNECSSPTICVQTGSCRCVPAECPVSKDAYGIQEFEAPLEPRPNSELGLLRSYSDVLVNDVARGDWRDVLRPEFRAYLAKDPKFPSIYLVDDYPGAAEIESAECHKLQPKHCFSADSILYRAMRFLKTTPEEADLIVLPVYQHCDGGPEFALHPVRHWANMHIPGVKEGTKRLAAVLTHDWGICIEFSWEIWSARDAVKPLVPEPILDNVLIWSVMGDYDSPCYRPHQDIVIPARTCLTPTLLKRYGDVKDVMPVVDRPKLVFWAGTYWGTGKSERLRWACGRGGAGKEELVPGGGPQSVWKSKDYIGDLGSARFCPQPRGIAGWSFRVSDAIYAGCIPVLTAEGTHYPFSNSLDWSKFSIRLLPTDLDRVEEILAAIPIAEVQRMQANLMLIRDAFLYSSDERPEAELERRGPMYWSLHEAGARLGSEYPAIKRETPDWALGDRPIDE